MRLFRGFLSVKIEGLDRYSAGVPLAVLLILVLGAYDIFPII
jgi:hypothetical protein